MLKLHILNVNHGDSIVVELISENNQRAYGVIDSNRISNNPPPALSKLQSLGATQLNFIALTHPDADHYRGMLDIFNYYQDNISTFYTFPIGTHINGRLKKLGEIYKNILSSSDSSILKSDTEEFIRILSRAKEYVGLDNWEEPSGFFNVINPPGFEDVEIATVLPPPSIKGSVFELIEKGSWDVLKPQKTNPLSLVFYIKYKGIALVLCGDADRSSWIAREQRCVAHGGKKLNATATKLPHHGSKRDCSQEVINHIYLDSNKRFGFISANGRSHPALEALTTLKDNNIEPYCTNLSKFCGKIIKDLSPLPNVAPDLARFIRMMQIPSDKTYQPCQGDISISINNHGSITIERQYNHPCAFRGDFDQFFEEN